jgi:hypothetical protein
MNYKPEKTTNPPPPPEPPKQPKSPKLPEPNTPSTSIKSSDPDKLRKNSRSDDEDD